MRKVETTDIKTVGTAATAVVGKVIKGTGKVIQNAGTAIGSGTQKVGHVLVDPISEALHSNDTSKKEGNVCSEEGDADNNNSNFLAKVIAPLTTAGQNKQQQKEDSAPSPLVQERGNDKKDEVDAGAAATEPPEVSVEKTEATNQSSPSVPAQAKVKEKPFVPLEPDATLQSKMNIIVNKTLKEKGTSGSTSSAATTATTTVDQFYNEIWKSAAFYQTWLQDSGKMDVHVGKWQSQDKLQGAWDKEMYSQSRVVTFQFKRSTHLYTGPPIANVRHDQWLRLEEGREEETAAGGEVGRPSPLSLDDNGNDDRINNLQRCILQMQISMQGIPFSDCFTVQIRWVTTRLQNADGVSIQVGLKVHFVKPTMLANKIESGTKEETTKAQLNLLDSIVTALEKANAAAAVVGPPPRMTLAHRASVMGQYLLFGTGAAAGKQESKLKLEAAGRAEEHCTATAVGSEPTTKSILLPEADDLYQDDVDLDAENDVIPPCFFWHGFCSHWRHKKDDLSNPLSRKALLAQRKLQLMLDAYHKKVANQTGSRSKNTTTTKAITILDPQALHLIQSELTDVHHSLDKILKLIHHHEQQQQEEQRGILAIAGQQLSAVDENC